MNKKLEKLMIEADKYAVSKMQGQPDGEITYYYDYTEKLAELIVKKCSKATGKVIPSWLDFESVMRKEIGLD